MEMIRIQVIDKSPENTNILKTILEKRSYFKVENITDFSEVADDIKLLFAVDPINNQIDLKDILDGEIPVILASDEPVSTFINASLQKDIAKVIGYPFKKIEVLSHIFDILGPEMKAIESKFRLDETFYQVRPILLKNKSENAPFNIYLKVGAKHLKILDSGSKNFNQALEIYEKKGVNFFFITQKDYIQSREFIIGAPHIENIPKEQQLKSVNEFFHTIVEEIGIGKSSIKLADGLTEQITKSLNKNSKKSILNQFDIQNIESDFIYNHSYMTSLICSQIVKKMNWDMQTVGKKLISACLFHDLAITDSKVAIQEHFHPDGIDKLDIKTRNLVATHHKVMANILKDHIEVDGDTIQIIKDSHFEDDGPSRLAQLRPLSFTFHLAHSYVVRYMELNFNHNKNQSIVDEVILKLKCDKHQNILDAFKESFN